MKMVAVVVALAATCSTGVLAEGMAVAGIRLGMTKEEIAAMPNYKCSDGSCGFFQYISDVPGGQSVFMSIGKIQVLTVYAHINKEGKASSVLADFKNDYYQELKSSLIKKYGKPIVRKTKLQNGYGGVFEGEKLYFRRGGEGLVVDSIGEERDQMRLFLARESDKDEDGKQKQNAEAIDKAF